MGDLLRRVSVFDGLDLAAPPLVLTPRPDNGRLLFQGDATAATMISAALGLPLPREACRASSIAGTAALWLGPDEWLLLTDIATATLTQALAGHPHALVDVTHRQAALRIQGPFASIALNAGCPLDLGVSAFPVDACTRTLFGKAEITLWRTGPDIFHVEAARSFIPYVVALLREASLGLA